MGHSGGAGMSWRRQQQGVRMFSKIGLSVGGVLALILLTGAVVYFNSDPRGFVGFEKANTPEAALAHIEGDRWRILSGGQQVGEATMTDGPHSYDFVVQVPGAAGLYKGQKFSIVRQIGDMGPFVCAECLLDQGLSRLLPPRWAPMK